MALTVTALLADAGDALYYDPDFRNVLETHMLLLRRLGVAREVIANDLVYQFEGNFYGYLVARGVPAYLHWVYLRVNNMVHPNEFGKAMRDPNNRAVRVEYITPDSNLLANIRSLYLTKKE